MGERHVFGYREVIKGRAPGGERSEIGDGPQYWLPINGGLPVIMRQHPFERFLGMINHL